MTQIDFDKLDNKEILAYINRLKGQFAKEIGKLRKISINDCKLESDILINKFLEVPIDNENSFLYKLVERKSKTHIGFLWYLVSEDFVKAKFAYIADIEIFKKFQGKGLGSKILRNLEKQFKISGISYIKLSVSSKNHKAINLYKKHKFSFTNLFMEKKL